jgi:DNA-binding CsgD family transcriptional regulator/tetratricopeptide (TPR) repeat protein
MESRVRRPDQRASLRGRAEECALLDGLVGDVRRGEGRSLVLRGEAGIGKTALLEYLVESASELTVVRTAGVESEMELAFASLQQLCAPLLDRLERLPGPQSDALGVVFGLNTGPTPDRFLVGLGVLSLLSESAEDRPVLCVVDDAQWLDEASALTLAFVSRRLLAEPVGIVLAAREPGDELQYLPELDVQGLGDVDARELLDSAVRFKLDQRVRERIIAETHGNPLALLELPSGLNAAQLAGGFGFVDSRALPGRIEESFIRRLEALAGDARRLLLLAAAEPVGDPVLLGRAAEQLGIAAAATDAAEAQGLLTIAERVSFRHPLVRSAVYRSATAEERRAVHVALANATDQDVDPDRRAWHLAAAAEGPDENVAVELERSAGRAQARGGLAAAAAFLRRAVVLTVDPVRRADRALAAAAANLQAGQFDVAHSLVATAETGPLDELQRAQVELLRGRIALFSTLGSDAPPLLLTAAQHLECVDAGLARDTYLDAWGAALLAGRLATRGGLLEVSRAARSAPRPNGPPRASDLLLDSLATLITDGRETAAPLLEEATRKFADHHGTTEANLRWGWLTVVPTYALWDETSTHAICVKQMQAVRDAGALAGLPLELATFDLLAVRCGDFSLAEEAIAEADALGKATGAGMAPVSAMRLAAFRGREEAQALIESVRQAASAAGQGVAVELAEWLLALVCNGLGRYEEAVAAARGAGEERPGEVFVSSWTAMELLEAATRSDNPELAEIALKRIVAATAFSDTDSAQGILARSRALVSEGEIAERWYREAIDRLGRSLLRPELARAHLLCGEWLRREGRRVDARAELRLAHEQLTTIGMEAFAERARRELAATGEKVRKRTVETREDLTPQEAQIARLARDGLSNAEIGGRLFISQHTVAYHLRKIFTKLGITSRNELSQSLPPEPSAVLAS